MQGVYENDARHGEIGGGLLGFGRQLGHDSKLRVRNNQMTSSWMYLIFLFSGWAKRKNPLLCTTEMVQGRYLDPVPE